MLLAPSQPRLCKSHILGKKFTKQELFATMGLLNLPQEILLEITQYVGTYDPYPSNGGQYVPYTNSLSALCKTCKTLHDIAQPVLRGRLCVVAEVCHPKLCEAVRSLLEKPEFAALVKNLDFQRWKDGSDLTCLEQRDVAALVNEKFEKYGITTQAGEILEIFPKGADLVDKDSEDEDRDQEEGDDGDDGDGHSEDDGEEEIEDYDDEVHEQWYNALVQGVKVVTIMSCPNATRVSMVLSGDPLEVLRPAKLPYLTELKLSHWDTEMSATIDDSVQWIFDSAPNLKKFCGFMIGRISSEIAHPSIESINLQRSELQPQAWQCIAQNFPSLHTLQFEAGGGIVCEEGETPSSDIIRLLGPCHKTLKTLSLDWRCSQLDPIWENEQRAISSFAELTALETLCIGLERLLDTDQMNGNFYTRLFPRSIQRLYLLNGRKRKWNLESLASVAANSFPSLHTITLLNGEEEDGGVMAALFKREGVTLTYASESSGMAWLRGPRYQF